MKNLFYDEVVGLANNARPFLNFENNQRKPHTLVGSKYTH